MVGARDSIIMLLRLSGRYSAGAVDCISLQLSGCYLVGAIDWMIMSLQVSSCSLVGAVDWILLQVSSRYFGWCR